MSDYENIAKGVQGTLFEIEQFQQGILAVEARREQDAGYLGFIVNALQEVDGQIVFAAQENDKTLTLYENVLQHAERAHGHLQDISEGSHDGPIATMQEMVDHLKGDPAMEYRAPLARSSKYDGLRDLIRQTSEKAKEMLQETGDPNPLLKVAEQVRTDAKSFLRQ